MNDDHPGNVVELRRVLQSIDAALAVCSNHEGFLSTADLTASHLLMNAKTEIVLLLNGRLEPSRRLE